MNASVTNCAEEETDLFLAGRTVPAGIYKMVGTQREVRLDRAGVLPATCDGHVAVYQKRAKTWAELHSRIEERTK